MLASANILFTSSFSLYSLSVLSCISKALLLFSNFSFNNNISSFFLSVSLPLDWPSAPIPKSILSKISALFKSSIDLASIIVCSISFNNTFCFSSLVNNLLGLEPPSVLGTAKAKLSHDSTNFSFNCEVGILEIIVLPSSIFFSEENKLLFSASFIASSAL